MNTISVAAIALTSAVLLSAACAPGLPSRKQEPATQADAALLWEGERETTEQAYAGCQAWTSWAAIPPVDFRKPGYTLTDPVTGLYWVMADLGISPHSPLATQVILPRTAGLRNAFLINAFLHGAGDTPLEDLTGFQDFLRDQVRGQTPLSTLGDGATRFSDGTLAEALRKTAAAPTPLRPTLASTLLPLLCDRQFHTAFARDLLAGYEAAQRGFEQILTERFAIRLRDATGPTDLFQISLGELMGEPDAPVRPAASWCPGMGQTLPLECSPVVSRPAGR